MAPCVFICSVWRVYQDCGWGSALEGEGVPHERRHIWIARDTSRVLLLWSKGRLITRPVPAFRICSLGPARPSDAPMAAPGLWI